MILNNNLRQQLNIKLLLFKKSTFIFDSYFKLVIIFAIFSFCSIQFSIKKRMIFIY